MYGIKAIVSKELRRVFKDKKMIMSLFVLPVILVVGLFSLIGLLVKGQMDDVESHAPVVYIMNEPASFETFAGAAGIEGYTVISDTEGFENARAGLYDKSVDLVMMFSDDFEEQVMAGMDELDNIKTPEVELYYNPSEDYSSEARSIYAAYLDAYKQMLLGNRFGNYAAVEMFNVNDNTVQDEDKAAGKMLGTMLPYFITMLIFAGAMGLGVDMIAGEKERGTLATMLLSPVKREQIVLGKVFSLSILAVMSAAVYIISMVIALPMMIKNVGGADALDGMSVNFTGGQIAQMIILMIGVVLLYVSIICMVAVFAENVKEASSYISPVYILVLVAGMITMYTSADAVFYKYLIPVYGSSMAFKDILTREITMTNFLGTTISTYLYAVIIVAVMTKAFNSERVMFNA